MPVIRRNGQVITKQRPHDPDIFKGDPWINPNWREGHMGDLGPDGFNPVSLNEVYRLLNNHRDRGILQDIREGLVPPGEAAYLSQRGKEDLQARIDQAKAKAAEWRREHPRSWDDRPPRTTPTHPRGPYKPRPPSDSATHEQDKAKANAYRKARMARLRAIEAADPKAAELMAAFRERNRKAQRDWRARQKMNTTIAPSE